MDKKEFDFYFKKYKDDGDLTPVDTFIILEALDKLIAKIEEIKEKLECQEFYEVCQVYRYTKIIDQEAVCKAYDNLKAYIAKITIAELERQEETLQGNQKLIGMLSDEKTALGKENEELYKRLRDVCLKSNCMVKRNRKNLKKFQRVVECAKDVVYWLTENEATRVNHEEQEASIQELQQAIKETK